MIDVSHWQGVIDWHKVKAAGVARAYLKATESINFRDITFPANYQGTKAVGIERAGYLFFRGDKSGTAQAKYFSDYVGADRGELAPAVDVEAGAAGVSRATFTQRLLECLESVAELFKRQPVIYTSKNKWDELTSHPAWIRDYDLWLAAPNRAVPPLPVGASTWAIHQFDWEGIVDGIDGPVDLDRENVVTPDPASPVDHAAAIRAHAVAIQGLAV